MHQEHSDALLTAQEAARFLRISLATLGRMERGGHLVPFRTPGGHRRYSFAMLSDYLERSRQVRTAPSLRSDQSPSNPAVHDGQLTQGYNAQQEIRP